MVKRILSVLTVVALIIGGAVATALPGHASAKTIYLADGGSGDGLSQAAPLGNLTQALAMAHDGDTIELTGNYLHQDGTSLYFTKNVTLNGAGHQLTTRLNHDALWALGANVTFTNITLDSRREGNDTEFRIFANGHDLTFDGVSTRRKDASSAPPTIYTGKPQLPQAADKTPITGAHSRVLFTNTPMHSPIEGVYAVDEGDTEHSHAQSDIPATITLDAGVDVQGNAPQIALGPNTANVTLNLHTGKFSIIDAQSAPNAHVAIRDVLTTLRPTIRGLKSLTVGDNATLIPTGFSQLQGTHLHVDGTLDLTGMVNDADEDGPTYNVGNVEGSGKILIPGPQSHLNSIGDVRNVTIEVQNHAAGEDPETGHTFVTSTTHDYTIRAKNPRADGSPFTFDRGVAQAKPAPPAQPQGTVRLRVVELDAEEGDEPIASQEDLPYTGELTPQAYFQHVATEFINTTNKQFVLLKAPVHAPVVVDGGPQGQSTITWKARQVGHYTIRDNGVDQPHAFYTVDTDNEGNQKIHYTLPALPANKMYVHNNQPVTDLITTLDESQAFTNRVIDIQDKPVSHVTLTVRANSAIDGVDEPIVTLSVPYAGAVTPENYIRHIIDGLRQNPTWVVVGNETPTDNGQYGMPSSIVWVAERAGAYNIVDEDGQSATPTYYSVTTADNGEQTVSYTLPPLAEGRKYLRRGHAIPASEHSATLTDDARFENRTYTVAPATDPTVKLIVRTPGNDGAELFTVTDRPWAREFTGAQHLPALVEGLRQHPHYVLTDAGTVNNKGRFGGESTITWTAQKVGTLSVDGAASPFVVDTDDRGQQIVHYTLPALPEGKTYRHNGQAIGRGGQKVSLEGEQRFANLAFTIDDEAAVPDLSSVTLRVMVVPESTGERAGKSLLEINGEEYVAPLSADHYFPTIVGLLMQPGHAHYVLLSDAQHQPTVTDKGSTGESTITWFVRHAGTVTIDEGNGKSRTLPFTVRTNAQGQTVHYELPAAPEGKKYLKDGVDAGRGNVTIEVRGDERFAQLVFRLVDDPQPPKSPQEPKGDPQEAPKGPESGTDPKDEPKVEPKDEPKGDAQGGSDGDPESGAGSDTDGGAENGTESGAEEGSGSGPTEDPQKDSQDDPKVKPDEDPKEQPQEPELGTDPKDDPKVEPKDEPKGDPKVEPKDEPKGDPKEDPKGELQEDPKPETKTDSTGEDTSSTSFTPKTQNPRLAKSGPFNMLPGIAALLAMAGLSFTVRRRSS